MRMREGKVVAERSEAIGITTNNVAEYRGLIAGLAGAALPDERAARRHVLLFASGVLVSMWVLVGVLLALRAAGTQVGWGYQLQSPTVVGALALLIFAAGLNMAGVFDLVPVGGSLSTAASRASRSVDAFMGGVLVTALATPCSAPFLAAAVAYAVTTGAVESFVVFTALGLGLVGLLGCSRSPEGDRTGHEAHQDGDGSALQLLRRRLLLRCESHDLS